MGVAKLADDAIAVTTRNARGSTPMLAAMPIPTGASKAAVALLERISVRIEHMRYMTANMTGLPFRTNERIHRRDGVIGDHG